uniref:ATP-binding cassette domain-containing protein n=2 Tax=Jeotgalibaca porci TaxID=1868793 RepID=UPI0035A042F9
GRKKVLDGVSFNLNRDEITCITGVNGTGKTTLMNAIMGLLPVEKGSVRLGQEPISGTNYNKIAYIADTITVPRSMTIEEAMTFMRTFYEKWNQEKADELLSFFKLQANDKIKELSKGNQAKVSILLGIAQDADFYLMDEPLSGIDMFAREQILEVFTSQFVSGKGVLLATHNMEEIETLVDRVIMLNQGIITHDFYAEELRETEGKSIIDMMREVYQG